MNARPRWATRPRLARVALTVALVSLHAPSQTSTERRTLSAALKAARITLAQGVDAAAKEGKPME